MGLGSPLPTTVVTIDVDTTILRMVLPAKFVTRAYVPVGCTAMSKGYSKVASTLLPNPPRSSVGIKSSDFVVSSISAMTSRITVLQNSPPGATYTVGDVVEGVAVGDGHLL